MLWERVVAGEKLACARAISVVENDQEKAVELLAHLYDHARGAYVIGITGPPGAGKSTVTDKVAKEFRKLSKSVGIIAVDPTSPFTRGAILGDRIRMSDLYLDPGVFIRSMGTRGNLGGVSRATLGAVRVLDAYGCDIIIVETVGVGQSEVDIVGLADTVLMVTVPGLGDDIQAIKAGILEIGDVFVVNKSDKEGAKKTLRDLSMMLDFRKDWKFRPPISLLNAERGEGMDELMKNLLDHRQFSEKSGELSRRKQSRDEGEMHQLVLASFEKKLQQVRRQLLQEGALPARKNLYHQAAMLIDRAVGEEK